MGAEGLYRAAGAVSGPAPLSLLRLWLDCRCLGLEWQGAAPDAAAVWAALLQSPRREAGDRLFLPLGADRHCRLLAVGETDCYAWEALLAGCAEPRQGGVARRIAATPRRALRRPALDGRGGLAWEASPARCAATRRWLASP
jgi:hypothetical protein